MRRMATCALIHCAHTYHQAAPSPEPKRQKTEPNVTAQPCSHPGFYGGVCIACGEPKVGSAAPNINFKYIHKALELTSDEAHRVRYGTTRHTLRRVDTIFCTRSETLPCAMRCRAASCCSCSTLTTHCSTAHALWI